MKIGLYEFEHSVYEQFRITEDNKMAFYKAKTDTWHDSIVKPECFLKALKRKKIYHKWIGEIYQ